MSLITSVQNSNLWSALRATLDLPPSPTKTPIVKGDELSPVIDMGAAGYLNPEYYAFRSVNISINGAGASWIMESTANLTGVGTTPTTRTNRSVRGWRFIVAGGTVTPITLTVQALVGAGGATLYSAAFVNPGDYFIAPTTFPEVLVTSDQDLSIQVSASAGGAGDTFAVGGWGFWSHPGVELPR